MKNKLPFYLIIVFAFILLFATYSNHFNNPFHFDDFHTISSNEAIRSLKNIPSFFSDASTTSTLPANQIYRPGLTTLNAIDYWIGGNAIPQPFYFHVSIFLSYVLLGILLYFLFLKIFNQTIEHKWNKYFALFGASFYCLHTANAETINYIISSGFFSTLMIVLSFVIYLYKPSWRNKYLYLIPVLIGFFVKEPTIMVAPLLLIYDMLIEKKISLKKWFSKNGFQNLFSSALKLLPLFILVVLLFALSTKMASTTYVPGGTSRFNYIITQPFVLVHYVSNFILPINLSADTDWVVFDSILNPNVLIGFVFLISLLIAALYVSSKKYFLPIAFGIVWFLLALLPTAVIPLSEVLNDHRTFFPYIGLALSFTWLFGIVAIHFQEKIERKFDYKLIALAFPLLLVVSHAFGTNQRNKVWSSAESLWYDVTIKSPKNGRGLMNYGVAKMAKGDYNTALNYFNRALVFLPNYSNLYINKAIVENAFGKKVEAEVNYKKALQLNPNNPESYFFYATFLKAEKRYKEALAQANNGLALSSTHSGNKNLVTELKLLLPNETGVVSIINENPTAENYLNLSLIHYQNSNYEKCIEAANEALKLKPDYAEAYNNICSAYNALKQWDKAIDAGKKGLLINSNYPLLQNNLNVSLKGKAETKQ